jgi:hypothetical protein
MQGAQSKAPMPPGDLRPAQLGIVLIGRVILGHVTATLVDLGQRGFVRIDEDDGQASPGWLLTDLRDQAADRNSLLPFEETLLDGLFATQPTVRLSEIGATLTPVLDKFRAQLTRDAIRHGRLHRWRRDEKPPRDPRLLKEIQDFRRQLRTLTASAGTEAQADLRPYAMIFGLGPRFGITMNDDHDAATALRRADEVPWPQTDRFVSSWLAMLATLTPNFVQQWSAPPDHGHANHGHDSGQGTSDYGHHGGHDYGHHGGHHGGFDGGGHGGFSSW